MKITLASTSKFKSEILNRVGLKHQTYPSQCEEISSNENPYEYVKELAFKKANSLKNKVDTDIIIGLDNIVLINGKIVEKPKNLEEAKQNIINSKNNLTKVITGITIINQNTNKTITSYQETNIKFKDIADCDINYYLANEKDLMYASGFIIENIASNFIEEIYGSYYNVLGAPVEKIYEILNSMNIYLKDIN